jgi:hypothetical protein
MARERGFSYDNITFEARYNPSFLLWDRSGHIWNEILQLYPDLRVLPEQIQPQMQVFQSPEMQVTLGSDQFRVTVLSSKSEKSIAEVTPKILSVVVRDLKIPSFTRVGVRTIRNQDFKNEDDAVAAAKAFQSEKLSRGMWQAANSRAITSLIRFEEESRGMQAWIRTERHESRLILPFGMEDGMGYKDAIRYRLVHDADYYSIGLVPKDIFDPAAFLNQALQSIKKYWEEVVG